MPTCFVIMGFGLKTDPATGRQLDLDKTYYNIIKPAMGDAGYDCVRADEILHSGMIDVPMYNMLFSADLVVADLSTSNLNAVFELGVRHALRPRATIVMAESNFTLPFDATHIVIQRYQHLGPDIGYSEVLRMQDVLKKLAVLLKTGDAVDSPVYTVLPYLQMPTLERHLPSIGTDVQINMPQPDTYAERIKFARQAIDCADWTGAESILEGIYQAQSSVGPDGSKRTPPPVVIQLLALSIYKAGDQAAIAARPQSALDGYAKAESLLQSLNVETTTDPETLGLWSAIHKRRAELESVPLEQRKRDLDEAIRAAQRGFLIKGDYYTGTNLAYLYDLRASFTSGDDRVADRVFADRVRHEVIKITEDRINELAGKTSAGGTAFDDERYWLAASRAEALVALGDPRGDAALAAALANAPALWMADTTRRQVDKLRLLLSASHP